MEVKSGGVSVMGNGSGVGLRSQWASHSEGHGPIDQSSICALYFRDWQTVLPSAYTAWQDAPDFFLGPRGKMRYKLFFPLISLLLSFAPFLQAQNWSGILDSSRAIDWSQAGILGGIPDSGWTQCATAACNTVLSNGPSSTGAQINAALASAPANSYVSLPAGTYNISGGITWSTNNVVLRGAGPTKTTLKFSSASNCTGYSSDVCLVNTFAVYDNSSSVLPPCGGGGASNCATWSSGYAKGTTQITLTNVGSNAPAVGSLLLLDQANDTSDPGGLIQCDNSAGGVCSGNGGSFGRTVSGVHYSQVQVVRITGINGSTYTISPGVYANNIRSSQTPGAWWSGTPLTNAGIENLTLDHTNSSGTSGLTFYDCYQCWAKNIRSLNSGRDHTYIVQSSHVVIRDSYLFGVRSGGGEESYGLETGESSDCLVENNIFDQISSPVIFDNVSGFVVAYNFSWDNVFSNPNFMQTSLPSHDAGNQMNLFEGNYFNGLDADNQHGASPLATVFRNWLPGNQPPPYNKTEQTQSFGVDAINRAWNIIGNVLGTPGYHNNYEASPLTSSANCNTSIYGIGWGSVAAGCGNPGPSEAAAGNDPTVVTSMMRWGNYDTVHNSVQWNPAEVPTTGIKWVNGNPVPANHNLPNSFYLNGEPSWWGSMPWPPIGPDVTGGQGPGGFAYQTPAYACYLNGTFTNGMLNFDASNCYGSSNGQQPPAPPTGLNATVQ